MRLRNPTDLAVGVLFIAFAVLGAWLANDLRVGTAMRMGPGYMPRLLCWILAGFGVLLVAQGFLTDGPPLTRWRLRPLVLILATTVTFGLLIERTGLVPAIIAVTLIGALASAESRPVEVVILATALAVSSALLFITALGLPMAFWRFPGIG